MQIIKLVVCDTRKGSLHTCKQIKPPLVGEHAFPLPGFVCKTAQVTICGSGGIMLLFPWGGAHIVTK